jgi:hypothetical protein
MRATVLSRRTTALVLAGALAFGGTRAEAATGSEDALAEPPRVFVLPLEVEGAIAKPLRGELATSLTDGLTKPGLELVQSEDAATYVVRVVVKAVDRDLDIRMELREREGDTVLAEVDELCELCGRTEAAETMTSLGLALHRRLEIALRPAPVVAVRSEPAGAMVLLDGEPLGTTPVELPVKPGKHELRITKAGYIAQTRSIDLVNGVRESMSFELQTIPAPERRRRPVRWAIGWTALAAGAASTVTGATLLALHGRPIRSKCHGAAVDADGTCRYVHSTRVSGAVIGAVGLGLLAAGIALVVMERKRPAKPATQARLGLGPLGPTLKF